MTSGTRQFMALTGLAAAELFRQPATLILIACNAGLTILVPLSISHQLGQAGHLAVDSALAFQLVLGMMLAGYAACTTLHNETRTGTILVVFSKPVGRLQFFLSKYVAVAILLAFFTLVAALATLLAERMVPRHFEFDLLGLWLLAALPFVVFLPAALVNFMTRRQFVPYALGFLLLALLAMVLILARTDSEGCRVDYGSALQWNLLPASLLQGLALFIMAAVALSLATRLAAPPTVACLAVVLFSGLITDHLANLARPVPGLASLIRTALPNLQSFWPADRLAAGIPLDPALLARSALYALTYSTGVLALGYAAFRNRQF